MPVAIPRGAGGGERSGEKDSAPLAIIGNEYGATFLPKFSPETVRARRQRNLDRTENFCKGEDVTDNGSKNYDIHITGRLVGPERESLMDVADTDGALDMSSATWSGEVRVKEVEFEGPIGWNPESGYYHFRYIMDLVSTGAGFRSSSSGNGIISDGGSAPENTGGLTTGLTQ